MSEITSIASPSRGPVDHNVREQILEAATEHFSRYGYEKTTVSDLAKAIGFSKAHIYKFFESKQASHWRDDLRELPARDRNRGQSGRRRSRPAVREAATDVQSDRRGKP